MFVVLEFVTDLDVHCNFVLVSQATVKHSSLAEGCFYVLPSSTLELEDPSSEDSGPESMEKDEAIDRDGLLSEGRY
jgi:hypothetical protein